MKSSSEFLGVLEDSNFPFLGVWASPSHLSQSGVATQSYSQDKIYKIDTKASQGFSLLSILRLLIYNMTTQDGELFP
jgi:hypothetical protein